MGVGGTGRIAEVSPKLGWMTESLEIDPLNSNKMFSEASNIGFDKAATGQNYMAIYSSGAVVDGVTGVYRSTDAGATWVRINDDAHQYGNLQEYITGDPRIYGRVYYGTNGRGIIYGDIQ